MLGLWGCPQVPGQEVGTRTEQASTEVKGLGVRYLQVPFAASSLPL